MKILVLNSGSSSIKYQLLEMTSNTLLVSGQVERIGAKESRLTYSRHNPNGPLNTDVQHLHIDDNHAGILAITQILRTDNVITAIGHRVVHGGEAFSTPTRINDRVIDILHSVSGLAPLHNPANLLGIEICRELFADIPQVAVFDTAFHQTMPARAYRYPLLFILAGALMTGTK